MKDPIKIKSFSLSIGITDRQAGMISFEKGKGKGKKKNDEKKSLDGPGVSGGGKKKDLRLKNRSSLMELHVFPFFSSRREAARLVDDADRDRSLLCRRLLIVFVENEFHSNGKGGKKCKRADRKDFRTYKHDDICSSQF